MLMIRTGNALPIRWFRFLRILCMGISALLWAAGVASAQGAAEGARLFAAANQAYEQGNFAEAARLGEQMVQYGIHNAGVYYNLGNAYFKMNRLGKAILCYEKARRLDPGDRDINENLAFVNAMRLDRIEEPEQPFWLSMLAKIHSLWPLDTQLIVLALLWCLVNAGFALRLLRREEILRKAGLYMAMAALLLLIPGILSAVLRIQEFSHEEAIIVAEKADVLSGPAQGNAVLASIHEGLKVEIRAEASDWVQVVLPNGWNGWVPRAAVERI
jgi:tetratricopeptide (TPR) repeat protein